MLQRELKATPAPAEQENASDRRLRFLVDESAGIQIAKGLNDFGYDAMLAGGPELHGLTTEALFDAACKEQRIIVTHNPEFLDNNRFEPAQNPGIIIIRSKVDGSDDDTVARCLLRALVLCREDPSWLKGKKLDFMSDKALTILSRGSRHRYAWKTRLRRGGKV
jgi:predicted nuclease of predicted toxin-antitoxin system